MRLTIAPIGTLGAGALLALGLVAFAPAAGATGGGGHGVNSQDSTCFTASGHTQGRSHSDPDGMSNGGADKPGCPGGFDADQDGNNGCGNDADREDDNKGHCGRQKAGPADAGGTGRAGRACPLSTSASTSTSTSTTTTTAAAPPRGPGSPAQLTVAGTTRGAGIAAQLTMAGTTAGAGTATDTAATTGTSEATAATTEAPATVTTPTAVTAPATEVLGEQISRPSVLARTGAGVGGIALLGFVLCGTGRLAVLARRLLRIG